MDNIEVIAIRKYNNIVVVYRDEDGRGRSGDNFCFLVVTGDKGDIDIGAT